MTTQKFISTCAVLVTALTLAGCGGSSSGEDASYSPPVNAAPPAPAPTPAPTPEPVGESFTDWSKNGVFAKDADGAPEIMDDLTFYFDGNDNPDAYSDLLPPEVT
jgi:hypothetical protein